MAYTDVIGRQLQNQPQGGTVLVAKGDTLSALARKYGTTVQAFAQANPDKIKDINLIYVGQKLNIPTSQAGTPSPITEGTPAQIEAPEVPTGTQQTGGRVPRTGEALGIPSMGFYSLMLDMQERMKKNDDLIARKNKILTQLYDRPLTQEEKNALTPSDMRAIESNDRRFVDLQLRMINDELKGRVDSMDNAFEFLTTGYKTEMAALEKKADNYRQSVQWALNTYGKDAMQALGPQGIDYDKLTGISTLSERKSTGETADIENYQYYASQERAAGREPVSFFEFSTSGKGEDPIVMRDIRDAEQFMKDNPGIDPDLVRKRFLETHPTKGGLFLQYFKYEF